jgi:hypothetical protein
MNSYNPTEKRREYRVPLAIPATFSMADGKETPGHIENISSWGVCARIPGPLAQSTSLKLSFKVPETDKKVESEGKVMWRRGDEPFSLGIAFRDKVSFDIPMKTVADICSAHETRPSVDYSDNERDLLQNSIKKLQYLTYWGNLFELSSAQICTLFSQLAGQIGLGSFRLEKIYKHIEDLSPGHKLNGTVKESISSIEQLSGRFNEIVSVFGLLKQKRQMELTKADLHIDLNHLIENEIDFFQDVITKLANPKCDITCSLETLPPVYGEYSVFALIIDFLLLYSSHSMLLGSSARIKIHSTVKNRTIHIEFCNDGSRIFKQDSIVIENMKYEFADQLTPGESSNMLTLYYLLIPLRKYNAYIVVHSESGNNIISLRIPI